MYSARDVGNQQGRTFVITGANSGIGYATAQILATSGARVLLCCRSLERGRQAARTIDAYVRAQAGSRVPSADVAALALDLADLHSIRAAAAQLLKEPRLDVLINNAGLMGPRRMLTADGCESQFGVNHLGHFALTNLVLPKLLQQPASRIVTVSSLAHKIAPLDLTDLSADKTYHPFRRYAMSKLANLLFTFELQRRLAASACTTMAVACHPGGAVTNLGRHTPQILQRLIRPLARLVINSPEAGALPLLRAATHADVVGGDYFGPAHLFETSHSAVLVQPAARALDEDAGARLWQVSAELTGTDFCA
ncbi:MAG: oxidoreductase [Pseudomonadota bacterium]